LALQEVPSQVPLLESFLVEVVVSSVATEEGRDSLKKIRMETLSFSLIITITIAVTMEEGGEDRLRREKMQWERSSSCPQTTVTTHVGEERENHKKMMELRPNF